MLLNNTIIGSRENFHSLVLEEGHDVVLFIYTTEAINEQ